MPSCTNTRTAFVLCAVGSFCVNGFILGRFSQTRHPSFPIRTQPRSDVMLAQTKRDIYEDGHPNSIYPTDILRNISINRTQTLAPDIAYFYLQNTLGLSEETMWKITLEAGSILGMTPRNLDKKVSLLRRTMNLSDEDVRVILGKQPAVLHYSAERNLAPTLLFLVRALDLSKSELRQLILNCPSILGYSLANLKKKLRFFWFTLGYSDSGENGLDSVRELLVGTPKLLLSAVDTGLVPRMNFLLNEIKFSLEELQKMLQKNPRLLLYSLDGNLREKIVFFFILQLHMEPEHVRKMLLSYPHIMDYNLENHMKPIAEYLAELEFSAAELGSIVRKFPRVFSYSLKRIKHVIGFLRFELDLDSRQSKRVIFQAPQVFGLGNMKEKLDFLRDHLDLTEEELGLVLSKMPTVMCLGVKSNLVPKLDYLGHALLDQNHPNDQLLKETILKQPTLLGYSLQGRIQPRMKRLVSAGISPNKITVGISMSEIKFQQWLSSSQSRNMEPLDLLKELDFSEDELSMIRYELPEISDWKVPSLRSWIRYLKGELGDSDTELKHIFMSHPLLLDGSSCRKVRCRLKKLRSADLSLLDYPKTIYWSGDRFDNWIGLRRKASRSKIAHLRRELGLKGTETRVLISEMPTLESIQSSKVFEQKLKYYMTEFRDSREDVISLLLGQPSLLDLSIKRVVEPRMQRIRLAGVSDPETVSALITMADDVFLDWWRPTDENITLTALRSQFSETIEFLESTMQLNQEETDSLLPLLPNNVTTRIDVESVLKFLLNLSDGDIERVKAAVLEQPHIWSYSLSDLESRIEKLRLSVHTTEDMIAIVTMTDEDFQKNLSLHILHNMLHLTQHEIDSIVVGSRRMVWKNTTLTLATKIDCLLSQGSKDDVKNVILSRPTLLSFPLEKLQNLSKLLATKRSKHATRFFGNESGTILKDALGLREEDVESVLLHSRFISLRDPEVFLRPKLNYLMSKFDGCKKHVASCVLENPGLLDYSLHDWIIPRMNLLIDAGLDPFQINNIIWLNPREINRRMELQTHLNLTDTELDHLIPMKVWLVQRHLRNNIEPTLSYLRSHLNGSISGLKQILLEEPSLLTFSLLKTIQPRMDMLTESGCPPTDIGKIVMLSQRKVKEYCTKCYLCRILDISSNQMDNFFASVGNTRQSSDSLREKVDYLLHHVFGGSKQKLKAAILEEPSLLNKSLKRTIQPRAEVLHFLESIGLEHHPNDMAGFFTQSNSVFTKKLAPKVKNWHPPVSSEFDDSEIDSTMEETRILATLKDFSLPLAAFAYSDESNRDGSRVVHWR